MKKNIHKTLCIIALLLTTLSPYSCESPLESLDTPIETLIYTGDNKTGKILSTKLKQDHTNDHLINSLDHIEFLFDHATISNSEKFGYNFSVPLKNSKNDKIESYLVFKIRNHENLSGKNLNDWKLEQGILVDSTFLDNLIFAEKYLHYYRFLQYKNEGLPVSEELCEYAKKWNIDNLFDNETKCRTTNQALNSFFIYDVQIIFNIDYWDPPAYITSWALSLQTIEDIFFKDAYCLLKNKYPSLSTLTHSTATTTSAKIGFYTYNMIPNFKEIMWDYMACAYNLMLRNSCVRHVTWNMRISCMGNPQETATLQHGGGAPIYSGLGGNDETEPNCPDEKCEYCSGCISPTTPHCTPCLCFSITIALNKSQLCVLESFTITSTLESNGIQGITPVYNLEISALNSGIWLPIMRSVTPTLTYKFAILGKYDVRVNANVNGREILSNVLQLEKVYPSYNDIVGDATVQSKMTSLWAKTLQNTTSTGRQELGCYIYVNLRQNAYNFEDFEGPMVGPKETAYIALRESSLTSETIHLVGVFHTHTPCTFRTASRVVGPSPDDIQFSTTKNIVGILYDYIGTYQPGLGMRIQPGHDLYDPATYSHFGINRRPSN